MQGRSQGFDATVQKSHTAVVSAQVIKDGKAVITLEPHAGSVTADRTAAQMRTFEFEIIDRDGTLTPKGMNSPLAPFGALIQVGRGVRIKNESQVSAIYSSSETDWLPDTSSGALVSIKVDPFDGSLTLGP